LAAAYALVLNVVLSGMLLAAMSPTAIAAGLEICHNNPDLAATQDGGNRNTGKPAAHCPVCVGNHAPGAPPEFTHYLTSRIGVAIASAIAPDADFVTPPADADHQARAPPRLS
jgi:hypothetical protein